MKLCYQFCTMLIRLLETILTAICSYPFASSRRFNPFSLKYRIWKEGTIDYCFDNATFLRTT